MKTVLVLLVVYVGVSVAQECGKPSTPPNERNDSRIINGQEAIPHSFPWMASIESSLTGLHYCAASLISPNWAVTAGHCGVIIYIGTYSGDTIAFGLHDRSDSHQSIKIDEVFVHPDYDSPDKANDIALIRWDDPIELNDEVIPICMPDQDDFGDSSSFGVGMNCYLSGWGKAGDGEGIASDPTGQPWNLRQAVLPLVADQDCQDIYLEEANFQIQPTMQCAGGEGKTSCNGDSGGPLVCENSGTWYQVGIVSFGPSPCDATYPAVYTRVAGYSNWVMETIAANGGL